MAGDSWYRTFFDDLYRASHRQYEKSATAAEALGAMAFLDLAPGSRILDVPCGAGRHAFVFAQSGYAVTGIDLSEEAIALAQDRLAKEGLPTGAAGQADTPQIEFLHGDMRRLPWRDRFDGAACLFNSFGYLGDEGDALALTSIFDALKPGGRLVLDLPNRDHYLDAVPSHYWDEIDTHWILCAFRFDAGTGVAETEYTYVPKGAPTGSGGVEHRTARVRWYTAPEMARLIEGCGGVVKHIYGGWDGRAFDTDTPKLIVLAEKPSEGE